MTRRPALVLLALGVVLAALYTPTPALALRGRGRAEGRGGAGAGVLAAMDHELAAALDHDMEVQIDAATHASAGVGAATVAGAHTAHELDLNTASVLALELHAAVHDAAQAQSQARAHVSAEAESGVEAEAETGGSAAAAAAAACRLRYELLYPCYVCVRAMNAFLAQYQAMVSVSVRSGVPVLASPKWNRTGICPQVHTNLVRPKDYGPCLRYENGVCLKRLGRPGVIAVPARNAAAEGEGRLDNPFTRVFGHRPEPNVTLVRAAGHGNTSVSVPLGNDTWCASVVDDLVADPLQLTKVFKTGCTVFPSLTLDEHWLAGGAQSVPSAASLATEYFPKADAEAGCRMRDACACLWQKGKPNIPYCPQVDPTEFDSLAYWSEPIDLYERRKKALSQRRQCVRIGPANPAPPQPKQPPVLPPGANAPKLMTAPDGHQYLMPTVVVPAFLPGQLSQANARKLQKDRSPAAVAERKAAEDRVAKKQADAAKQHQKERKLGPKKKGVTKLAPNF